MRSGSIKSNCEKLRKYCGVVTKPLEASKSDTSAQGTHRAPTSTPGGQAKEHLRKTAEICIKNCEIAKNCGPQPPPPAGVQQSSVPAQPDLPKLAFSWLEFQVLWRSCYATEGLMGWGWTAAGAQS